jgi:hypothetical protein
MLTGSRMKAATSRAASRFSMRASAAASSGGFTFVQLCSRLGRFSRLLEAPTLSPAMVLPW